MILRKPSVRTLANKSRKIVDVFTETINELKSVNEKTENYSSQKKAQKDAIELELTQLDNISANNSRVIEKIEKILE